MPLLQRLGLVAGALVEDDALVVLLEPLRRAAEDVQGVVVERLLLLAGHAHGGDQELARIFGVVGQDANLGNHGVVAGHVVELEGLAAQVLVAFGDWGRLAKRGDGQQGHNRDQEVGADLCVCHHSFSAGKANPAFGHFCPW